MQQRSIAFVAPRSVHPLRPADDATPVALWGWSWEPPALPLNDLDEGEHV